MGPAVGTQSYVAGGQADTQILLVLDNAAKTWQLLQINRDSMVEVPVLSMMGTVTYTIKQQIALAMPTAMAGSKAAKTMCWQCPCCWTISPSTDIFP